MARPIEGLKMRLHCSFIKVLLCLVLLQTATLLIKGASQTETELDADIGIPCPVEVQNANNTAVTQLVLNPCTSALPLNYRKAMSESVSDPGSVSIVGLDTLRISGSGQYCIGNGRAMLDELAALAPKVAIIDLRHETHVMLNDLSVSWYCPLNWEGYGYTLYDSQRSLEAERMSNLLKLSSVPVYAMNGEEVAPTPSAVQVESAMTEQEYALSNDASYHRLLIFDHVRPTDAMVELFVASVQQELESSNGEVWFHIHCKDGQGRTTTAMAMLDMLKNAHQVSFDDILHRQHAIGGVDLGKTSSGKSDSFFALIAQQRLEFLQKFYLYCQYLYTLPEGRTLLWTTFSVLNTGLKL